MSMPPPAGPPIAEPPSNPSVTEVAGGPPVFGTPPPPPPGIVDGVSNLQLSGFWRRLAALLLDNILYGLLASVFIIAGLVLIAARQCYVLDGEFACYDELVEPWSALVGMLIIGLGVLFVLWLYVRAIGRTGQSWGARIVGVKVVRADDGTPIGFGKALGRTLFGNIISANVFYLGYLWMLWDDRKQTWQDKVVSSIVIDV
jgi:uncharacterized RDD family membrane protein YckC